MDDAVIMAVGIVVVYAIIAGITILLDKRTHHHRLAS